MKEKYLKEVNVLNDVLFKALMCHERNRTLVVDVLHALTGIKKESLYHATYIGGEEILKSNLKEKKQATDLTIRINDKNRIIVEMNQFKYVKNLYEKNTTYAFSLSVKTTPKNVQEYPRIILINIDNFNRFNTKNAIIRFKLRDEEGHIETEIYESIHLILVNAKKNTYNGDKDIQKFAQFLRKGVKIETLEKECKGEKKYMEAIETIKELATNEEFVTYYDLEEKHKWELENVKMGAYEEATKKNSLKIAKNMLEMGIKPSVISKATNISMKELKNLEKKV